MSLKRPMISLLKGQNLKRGHDNLCCTFYVNDVSVGFHENTERELILIPHLRREPTRKEKDRSGVFAAGGHTTHAEQDLLGRNNK